MLQVTERQTNRVVYSILLTFLLIFILVIIGGKNFFNPYEKKTEAVVIPEQWQSKLPLTIHHQKSGVKRPSTPEE